MKRDYLNLRERMHLYVLLQSMDAIARISEWEWLDAKTRGYFKAFRTRFDNHYDEFIEQLPKGTIESMMSFTDGYVVQFKTKVRNPADDAVLYRRSDIADLLEILITDHCFDCQKTVQEAKACKIRKAQARLMHCRESKRMDVCEYKYIPEDQQKDAEIT